MIEAHDVNAEASKTLSEPLLSTKEQVMLAGFEDQRRLHLLGIIVPALLAITLLALPLALYGSWQTHSIFAIFVDLTGIIPYGISLWAVRKKNVNLAAAAVFVGVTGSIIALVCGAGLVGGTTDLATLVALSMFILPIAVTSLLGTPRLVIYITVGAAIFTLLFFLLLPHSHALESALQGQNASLFILIPIILQITFGVLMYAATLGFQRVHRELGDMRVAYAREKELERLKDYFISSVNHELRTPIMALQGYIVLARELAARRDIDRQERLLARGEEAIKHLANLVESVLNVKRLESNVQPMHIKTFDLHPVILAATTMLDPRDAAQKERPLHLIVSGEIRIYADEDRVR
ncbi:MAG TPA: histidine kinase dimerization/phospho-acceptor domain-containing protein, partial [Ktedonobacterales bacterium]|nr:histidine kinase dimerization/phospho-acceptor domain-containing protein [Ktedonobacterales bacterium]